MTSNVLHREQNVAAVGDEPRFDPAIGSRALTAMLVVTALLLVAFFVYGQMAPGA